jgi:hypothetical protein
MSVHPTANLQVRGSSAVTELAEAALDDLLVEWEKILHVRYESLRHYPSDRAAQLLGFVNRNDEASEGGS